MSRNPQWLALFLALAAIPWAAKGIHGQTKNCLAQIPATGACIGAAQVNEALELALKSHGTPSEAPDFVGVYGNVADILNDVTQILANKLGVPPQLAAVLFPQIDTLQTNILQICPKPFVPGGFTCQQSNYRRLDGYCMNPQRSTWGGAAQAMKRFVLPHFADGLSAPRALSVTGRPLPEPRLVSNVVHGDLHIFHERTINFLFLHWGQFIDHDITDTPSPADHAMVPHDYECCGRREHRDCHPLAVPPGDPFAMHGRTCMGFLRSRPAIVDRCSLGHRTVMNGNTPTIDGSGIYGRTDSQQYYLREFRNGRLKDHNPFVARGLNLKPLLPLKMVNPDHRCSRDGPDSFCFYAGDYRVMTHPGLTSMHILMVRLHNWAADHLQRTNPHWNDERIFQEARRIVAALLQHVTYNEFLPNLLNKQEMDSWNLWVSPTLYAPYGWDPTWDPQVSVYFSSAAYRCAHSLVPWKMDLYSTSHKNSGMWELRHVFSTPKYVNIPGMVDQIFHGAVNQPAESMDATVNEQLRNWLFAPNNGNSFGHDLAARNIARGREHAIPGYLTFWRFCQLKPDLRTWQDLLWVMPNQTVARLQQVYADPEDIDLWTGGIAELKFGGVVGPTFACLISEQFANIKRGDRFWYENSGLPSSFTPDQLSVIKRITLARLLCDHLDNAQTMPKWAMLLPDVGKNPQLACNTNAIPRFNFEPWREPAPPFYKVAK